MSRQWREEKQTFIVRAPNRRGNALGGAHIQMVWKSDIVCSGCGAGYRRVGLATVKGTKGEYRCLICNHVLEVFDESFGILICLTIPSQHRRKRRRQGQSVKKAKTPLLLRGRAN
jgi:hypothetical protein